MLPDAVGLFEMRSTRQDEAAHPGARVFDQALDDFGIAAHQRALRRQPALLEATPGILLGFSARFPRNNVEPQTEAQHPRMALRKSAEPVDVRLDPLYWHGIEYMYICDSRRQLMSFFGVAREINRWCQLAAQRPAETAVQHLEVTALEAERSLRE